MSNAEERLAHMAEMNRARRQRYRSKYGFRYFSVQLKKERFDLLDKKLKEKGISKVQFIENAIDKFLEE